MKPELQDGDVILVHANSFSTWYRWLFSHLIRLFDGCYYNHAQIYFDGKVYEADLKVREIDFEHNTGDNVMVLRPNKELSAEEKKNIIAFLQKEMGKPYGFGSVIFFQTLYILTFRRIWLGKKSATDDHPYCTSLVTRCYNRVRGYFPEYYLTSPSVMKGEAPLYFYTTFEGKI